MQIIETDLAIIGGGGAGLSAALAAIERDADIHITLLSKVYSMRSHTVAAEGGAAGVINADDSFDSHFYDTVSGGDWLCDQDVVDFFVQQAPKSLARLERLGCPWDRKYDGSVNVRRFGGMSNQRTWFAADKTGFHLLHTLFQSSLRYSKLHRLDEYFVLDLLVNEDQVTGIVALNMLEGKLIQVNAKSVIMATGGAGRLYRYNTNANIVTGEGMAIAFQHGVPLRDMEFVQYHPTGLPGSGILMTEGCRGEGGILVNKDGYRYLQDYDLGPETALGKPQNRYMELGLRDKLSQAFWHESQKGRTIPTPAGDVVYLDLRHLGETTINQRLPFIRELTSAYLGINPAKELIPVRPTAHYTMGGIHTDKQCATNLKGFYAVGECASVGLHGANRLGSNSLSEIVVFGEVAGNSALNYISSSQQVDYRYNNQQAKKIEKQLEQLLEYRNDSNENWANIRNELGQSMDDGCGVYRNEQGIQKTIDKLIELTERIERINIGDKSHVYNTELLEVIELKQGLLVAKAMACSAILRKESRGAHQRLEDEYKERDDQHFLKHSLASYQPNDLPKIEFVDVNITKLPPSTRAYGAKEKVGK